MLQELIERVRCIKHNLFDKVSFRVTYKGGLYHIRTVDGVALRFHHNPFLGMLQVTEGYLNRGAWTIDPGMVVVDAVLGRVTLGCTLQHA